MFKAVPLECAEKLKFFRTFQNLYYNIFMNCYFFGTFNPIHIGHKEISKRVKKILGFDKVIFVPSYMPPHKIEGTASYMDRLTMVRLTVGEENVSNIELKLKVPSYTYRTIEKLSEENNNEKINFIIGYDQFFQIENWKEPKILKEKIHFLVIPRRFKNGQTLSNGVFRYLENKGFSFEVLNIDFLDISSSMIRKLIENNEDIMGLVTLEVKKYIEEHRLYKKMAIGKFI